MNHFQGAKDPVLINSTPYESKPEVMGLLLPIAHMQGIKTACSSYVKNIERIRRNDGTMQASAVPRRKRTTKRPAKFLHAIWR